MTALPEACAGLAAAIPQAAALLAEPDTDGTTSHGRPGSRPPWNQAAANALFDAHALVRDVERLFRYVVTGRPGEPRAWSDGNTAKALEAIEQLGYAMPQDHVREKGRPCQCDYCRAARSLDHAVTAVLQLPAVDEQERPQRVGHPCPYCGLGMLRAWPRSRKVACIRLGACEDGDGNPPAGRMAYSRLDGSPVIEWSDGLVT